MRYLRWLSVFAIATLILLFAIAPKIPQPQTYHDFADQRTLIAGVPNTLNTLSNLAFVAAGVLGLAVMRRPRRFANAFERRDAFAFFIGTLLTAIGSSIYHFHPNDATLVWDRAGMIVAFMAFLAMLIHERLDAAPWILPSLIAFGAVSIVWWRMFDDLRLYGWVQFFPLVALIVIEAADRPRHTRELPALAWVAGSYAVAKVFETFDRQTCTALHEVVSGHTLKHVAAAVGPAAVAVWIARREERA